MACNPLKSFGPFVVLRTLRASSSRGPISMRMQDAYVADALHYVVNAANLTISVLNDRTMAVASK